MINDPREADVGSILGFGFAPFTGGALSYIDVMGAAAFGIASGFWPIENAVSPQHKPDSVLRGSRSAAHRERVRVQGASLVLLGGQEG